MTVYITKENINRLLKTGQSTIRDDDGEIDYIEFEDAKKTEPNPIIRVDKEIQKCVRWVG